MISLLRRNRDFRLLFFAQVVSFSGDWFLFVALAGLVYSLTHSPGLVAAVYAALTVPFALFQFIGGPLADRLNRQALMIVADVLRGFLALGFFVIHTKSQIWMVYVLAGAITALGAVFEPASMAAMPNLVDREDLGLPLETSLARWGAASDSGDVRLVADVLALHVGSGLPRVLDRVCAALREREAARREVGSLTAQARLSGTILGLLPIGFFLFLSVVSRHDMTAAYSSPLGLAAIVAGLVLDGLAFLWIRALIRVDA